MRLESVIGDVATDQSAFTQALVPSAASLEGTHRGDEVQRTQADTRCNRSRWPLKGRPKRPLPK